MSTIQTIGKSALIELSGIIVLGGMLCWAVAFHAFAGHGFMLKYLISAVMLLLNVLVFYRFSAYTVLCSTIVLGLAAFAWIDVLPELMCVSYGMEITGHRLMLPAFNPMLLILWVLYLLFNRRQFAFYWKQFEKLIYWGIER
jgi:hypothetical protein